MLPVSVRNGILIISLGLLILPVACGKGGSAPPPPDPCRGVTVSLTATTTNPSAPGQTNGSITASATGASGFTYSINGGTFQSSGSFTGLGAGSYTITAKSSNGCTGSASFTLTASDPCAGVTIGVTATLGNPSAPGQTNGSISAAASGGTAPYTFSLNGGTFQASGNFSGLAAGVYTVTARDANNCSATASFTLTAPNPCAGVIIAVTAATTNPTGAGLTNGSINASATGGTGPYTYSLNGGTFQASGLFSNLGAGTYSVTARDANTCSGTASFTLTAPSPCAGVTIGVGISVNGNTPCQPNNGSITITPSGGLAPYSFSLNGGTFQSGNTFSNLGAGVYAIAVRDLNGCTGTNNSVVVSDRPAGPLFQAVRNVIQSNCVSCHNATTQNGGMNFSVDCNIVANKDRIQARAVAGNPSAMPPTGLLPTSERQKITDWINAGGRITD